MEKIRIVAFFDENLIESFLVQYSSLEKNLKRDFEYYIGISPLAKEKLNNFLISKSNIRWKIIDKEFNSEKNSLLLHVTQFTYARFYIFDIFPELVNMKKIIYADPDIIFLDFPYHLIDDENNNFAISNSEKGQKPNSLEGWMNKLSGSKYKQKIEKLIIENSYFNAGLLIINDCSKMINLFSICKSEKYDSDDQTLLNYHNDYHLLTCDETQWNYQPKHMKGNSKKIIHFTGRFKPWMIIEDEYKISNNELLSIDIYNEYFMFSQSLGYIEKTKRKINFIVINHDKDSKFIRNIIKMSNKLLSKYGEYVRIFILSSKHSEDSRKEIAESKIDFYEFDENLKKFGKLREFNKMNLLDKNDYVQIVDADDVILTELLPQLFIVIQDTFADILKNSTLKIDPILFKDQIYYAKKWSGVSSNTIFRWGILREYFKKNEYDGILSEDNIRYIYALLQKEFPVVQNIDIPFYLGIRWWEGKISHSSSLNTNSDYIDSIQIISILEEEKEKIYNFVNMSESKGTKIFRVDNILKNWNLGSDFIKSEMIKKMKSIFSEHIREGKKEGVAFKKLVEEVIEIINKINLFGDDNIDELWVEDMLESMYKEKHTLLEYNSFYLNVPGGILEFDPKTLEYNFKIRGGK